MSKILAILMVAGSFSAISACAPNRPNPATRAASSGELKEQNKKVQKDALAAFTASDRVFDTMIEDVPADVGAVNLKTSHTGQFELKIQFKNGDEWSHLGPLTITDNERLQMKLDTVGALQVYQTTTEPKKYCPVIEVNVVMGEIETPRPLKIHVCEQGK